MWCREGDSIPTLPRLSYQDLNPSGYCGKVVLLGFWRTWCEPCWQEISHSVDLQNKYRDQGFQMIGVSMDDSPQPVQASYRQFGMNYSVMMANTEVGGAVRRSTRIADGIADRQGRAHIRQAHGRDRDGRTLLANDNILIGSVKSPFQRRASLRIALILCCACVSSSIALPEETLVSSRGEDQQVKFFMQKHTNGGAS